MFRQWRSWWDARRVQKELAEEIETHRALIERRLRQTGASAADAAAESRRLMGNDTLAREDARAVWVPPSIDSVLQDVRYALRMVLRAPGFAAAMIVVMGVGIGATTGVFGILDGLVLRSLPVTAPDRLVYFSRPSFSYPVFQEVRARSTSVLSNVVAWDMDRMNVAWNQELEPAEILMASGDFYSMLGVNAVVGRTFMRDDDQVGGGPSGLVAVISHAAWQRRFGGNPAVIGRPLRIERHTFTIIGVTPQRFFGVAPGLAPEITIPLTSTRSAAALQSTTSSWVHLLGRLHDGPGIREANAALHSFWPAVLAATTHAGMPPDRRAMYLARTTTLEPGYAGYSRVRNTFEEPLWLLLALVALLLTVACASAANLLLARAIARRREIAVRLAIGAGRWRLVRQLLTESLVWTAFGAAAGLFLASWGGSALVAFMRTTEDTIVLDMGVNWRMLAFSTALAAITGALCAIVPARRATRLDPSASLKGTVEVAHVLGRRWSFGKVLVAAQVALAMVLLVGAALFVRSLDRVLSRDAGVDRERVLVVAPDAEAADYEDERLARFFEQVLERARAVPGVESASLSMYPPISDEDGAWSQAIGSDGNPPPSQPGQPSVYFNSISPDYFRTVGMRLTVGRDFGPADAANAMRVVIVNETLVRRFFQGQSPVGRHITMGRNQNRQDLEIVGIVSDAKYQRLQEEPRSIAYVPWTQQRQENLFVELRGAGPLSAIADGVRREIRAIDAIVPVRVQTVTERIRESLVTERVIALLATGLGAAALALACAGLYGLLAYAVSRQTREIGVRIALGAERGRVLRMILGESQTLAFVGVLAGLGIALGFGRFAANLLFQVSPRDPLALSVAAAVMLGVAGLAGYLPARRAARVDPVVALRAE
jgi:putative ABC transport system permease protein